MLQQAHNSFICKLFFFYFFDFITILLINSLGDLSRGKKRIENTLVFFFNYVCIKNNNNKVVKYH